MLPYLQHLDADPMTLGAKKIDRLLISTARGKTIETKLPSGGFGISRYTLDHFLFQKSLQNNCTIIQDAVTEVIFTNDLFRVTTNEGKVMTAKIVIGAYGKRSKLDINLGRSFIKSKSPFIGVKKRTSCQALSCSISKVVIVVCPRWKMGISMFAF